MNEKKTNNWLLYVLLLAVGLLVTGYFNYNKILNAQKKLITKVDFRFKSYDMEYFSLHNYVLPNIDKTRGKICVDTSFKTDFYTGDKKVTPFYEFMDYLDCEKEGTNVK
jgi:hypothetical protein